MQAFRTGQEEQLGALGLVLHAAVLWTSRYLDAAVEQLRALPAEAPEHHVLHEDGARLSPLKAREPQRALPLQLPRLHTPAGGGLRPLRDPATADTDEEG